LTTVLLGKPKDVRVMFPETMKLVNLLTVVPASSAMLRGASALFADKRHGLAQQLLNYA